ncbi:sugar MFS transporter [Reichenbachiella carrageenanivorans]|uniref:Sugar MFS transporter n=1 Tax=Reichenbachiella carrageenanivorans TaxID=2979869 RepID=A0ABY6D273_9BACT|nr:sugar MFS transporter [Reichenbachiella carrageenanivorans]UXX77945.1 sugar MFS transporter [Reichenbachiella carrageenanivorans]
MSEQKGSMIVPISIVAGLFATLGFITWVNGALIPFMKSICELTDAESFLVASASYISFCVMALPASFILQKIGYKKGMSFGLLLMAAGALVFIPAASSRTYFVFLTGIFIQGAGMTLLQTAVNPYITILGPMESAAKRISIMGICNKAAGAIGSVIFGTLLLSGINEKNEMLAAVGEAEKETLLNTMASGVVTPYIVMAAVLVVLALLIRVAPLPDIEAPESDETNESGVSKTSIFQFPHLWLGVLTLFTYVGAEVIAGDSIIKYGLTLGLDNAEFFTSFTLGAMIVTYLLGVVLIPKFISQETALKISAILGIIFSFCILFTTGFTSVLFVASLGIANALVWPAVWPLALNGLGKFTKTASALLVMGISGGAVIPPLYGALEDAKKAALTAEGAVDVAATAATGSYWILLPCYAVILFYAFSGHRIGLNKK